MTRDIVALVGLGMIGIGVAFIYWPAAIALIGTLLLGGAVVGHMRGGKQ